MKNIFLISLFFGAIQSNAVSYYVATNGSNVNPVTLALPWSISHAFSTAASGDTNLLIFLYS
jgi:hypothetical protein